MSPPVRPEPIGRVLTGDEWEAAQYAPHRLTSDPKKPLPPGRVLTGDEWEQAQRAGSLRNLTFPAMPKFAADATRRLNPNAGKPDRTPTEYLGDAIREYASDIEHAPSLMPATRGVQQLAGILGRQVVAPIVEHPIMTAAMMNPVGAVAGGMMAAHTVAKYGWQVAHESQMTPEERAEAQKDPERVSGEAAAVQAVMLGLGAIAGVRGARAVGDVGAGMMEAGARGVRETDFGLTAEAGDAAQTANLRAQVTESARRYFETEKGAEVLGTTAGAHGLPETASPFPPASALDVAWKQGHEAATPKPPAEPVDAAGFTQSHKNAYRIEQNAAGLRLISPDEALRMSPEELRAYADQVRAGEKDLEGQALDPETLKRFKAAERKANSQFAPAEETDAAVKVMQDIEDKMTPIQRLRMYGHRELDYTTAEDARAMADAAERVRPEVFIADEQAGHPVPTESLLSDVGRLITTGNANLGHSIEHPAALIQLRGTVAELQRRGMTTDQILKTALEERVRRGYATPDQALELAKARLEKLQSGGLFGAKPTEPVPQITEGQRLLPAPQPEVAPPVTSEAAPTANMAGPGEPGYKGPAALYGRLSDDALATEYRALLEKRTTEEPGAQAPLWDAEREARAVEQIENRRRPDGSLSPADKRRLDYLQAAQGEEYGVGRHTFETAAAERRLSEINKHITAIEKEIGNRGKNPTDFMQAPAQGGGGLTPIEGTGETVQRGLARSTERQAVEADLVSTLGDLPEYRRMNMKEQSALASDFLARDPEAARRVALGDEQAPEGLQPESVFIAMRNKARMEGDVATLHDLAQGGLTEQATTMGQRIRMLGERDPEDPVAAMQSVMDKRSGGKGAEQAIRSTVKEIEGAAETVNLKSLMDFFDSMKC